MHWHDFGPPLFGESYVYFMVLYNVFVCFCINRKSNLKKSPFINLLWCLFSHVQLSSREFFFPSSWGERQTDKCYALKGAEKATKTDESTSEHGSTSKSHMSFAWQFIFWPLQQKNNFIHCTSKYLLYSYYKTALLLFT